MTWLDLVSKSSDDQTLKRARSCLGRFTVYAMPGDLGGAASDPVNPFPRDCDCSGFVTYAMGIPRQIPPGSDRWLSTNEIWAYGSATLTGLFEPSPSPRPGDLLVYPHYKLPGSRKDHAGHVGIITSVAGGAATEVIHCSAGNYHRTGDAVQITEPAYMGLRDNYRTVRPNYDLLRSRFGVGAPVERLILARPNLQASDGFTYVSVPSARLVAAEFQVDPAEVAAIVGRAAPTGLANPQSIRSVLTALELSCFVDLTHEADPVDPRAYVFVEFKD